MVDKATGRHGVGSRADLCVVDRVGKAVPTVPTHRRCQGDLLTDHDAALPFGGPQGVFRPQRHHILSFFLEQAGDPPRRRIEL